jgi:AmpD protein
MDAEQQKIDLATGWLEGARRVASPNCDARPPGVVPELIVVHCISLPPGEFGGPWIDALFTNTLPPDAHPYFSEIAALRVSAHALIRRDGSLVQYVPFHLRAWHAGVSCWNGREACNDFSVGIELEGTDEGDYETPQYVRLATLVDTLCRTYRGLSRERIAGHSEVAPGRKTDPGRGFAWDELARRLA